MVVWRLLRQRLNLLLTRIYWRYLLYVDFLDRNWFNCLQNRCLRTLRSRLVLRNYAPLRFWLCLRYNLFVGLLLWRYKKNCLLRDFNFGYIRRLCGFYLNFHSFRLFLHNYRLFLDSYFLFFYRLLSWAFIFFHRILRKLFISFFFDRRLLWVLFLFLNSSFDRLYLLNNFLFLLAMLLVFLGGRRTLDTDRTWFSGGDLFAKLWCLSRLGISPFKHFFRVLFMLRRQWFSLKHVQIFRLFRILLRNFNQPPRQYIFDFSFYCLCFEGIYGVCGASWQFFYQTFEQIHAGVVVFMEIEIFLVEAFDALNNTDQFFIEDSWF